MKNRDREAILDFLRTADFKAQYGYSYTELLEFLNYYQIYYRQIQENNMWVKNELEHRDKILSELNKKISILEERLEFQSKQVQFLKKHLTKKLSLWERITGKIKL
jgi:hypothetical protein